MSVNEHPIPRSIGLAVDTVGSYGREVIRGVMEFCHRNPHWTIAIEPRLWVYDEEPQPDQWAVDGLIIQAYDQNVVDRVRKTGTPAVNVANMEHVKRPLPTIVPDDAAVGVMAAEYLLSVGFPHYAMCAHGVYEFSTLRRQAFVERMKDRRRNTVARDRHVKRPAPAVAGGATETRGRVLLQRRLGAPDAVCRPARRAGVRVPDEVAVLGVDDDELLNTVGALPLSQHRDPRGQDRFRRGRDAGSACSTAGKPRPLTRLPPLCVVPRATTDVTFVEDRRGGQRPAVH